MKAMTAVSEDAETNETVTSEHITELERQLVDERARNRELRVELERADANLEDLRVAMRMLAAAPQDRGPKKRWFRRSGD